MVCCSRRQFCLKSGSKPMRDVTGSSNPVSYTKTFVAILNNIRTFGLDLQIVQYFQKQWE